MSYIKYSLAFNTKAKHIEENIIMGYIIIVLTHPVSLILTEGKKKKFRTITDIFDVFPVTFQVFLYRAPLFQPSLEQVRGSAKEGKTPPVPLLPRLAPPELEGKHHRKGTISHSPGSFTWLPLRRGGSSR